MKVTLGKFACASLEARFRDDPGAGVQAALLHYTRRLRAGRRPVELPRFPLDVLAEPAETFDLLVDPDVCAILKHEADRSRVPIGHVLTHAVFVYLADMDAAGDLSGPEDGIASAGSSPAASATILPSARFV